MDIFTYGALLVAAASHAGWNAVVKNHDDQLHGMVLVAVFTSLVAACFLPFANFLSWQACLWLIGSLVLHLAYKICLTEAYKIGDFAQIYPIARGTAPLLVLVAAFVFLGETINPTAIGFILLLVVGVWLASYKGGRDARFGHSQVKPVLWALLTAVFIACYVMADGIGARLSRDAFSYIIWLMSLDGALFVAFTLLRCGKSEVRPMVQSVVRQWKIGVVGGGLSLIAYGVAIWAMTKIPLALASSLRETGILFALLLAWLVVKEPMNRYRVLAAVLIVIGAIGIKFA